MVHFGPLERSFYLFSVSPDSLQEQDSSTLDWFVVNLRIAFLLHNISATFPQLLLNSSDWFLFAFSVVAQNLSMTGSIRLFSLQKLLFSPKSKPNVQLKVKLSNMTDWHILTGLKIDVLIASRRLSMSPQNAECVSRYSASGHLQKFAAYLTLSTPKNSQSCKMLTLSLNSNQNLHPIASWIQLYKLFIKLSFDLSNQKNVMQHFDS